MVIDLLGKLTNNIFNLSLTLITICQELYYKLFIDYKLSGKAIQRTNNMILILIDTVDGPPFSVHNINNYYYIRPKQNFSQNISTSGPPWASNEITRGCRNCYFLSEIRRIQ